ncbi:hypothetical protein AUP68_02060 [Ilyonectria robusta]
MSDDEGSGLRAQADPIHHHDASPETKHNGITTLLGQGQEVEIQELDKSGNITQRWLHTPDNHIVPVPTVPDYLMAPFANIPNRSWPRTSPTTSFSDRCVNGARSFLTPFSRSDSRTPSRMTTSPTRHTTLFKPSFPPSPLFSPTAPSSKVSESAMPTLPPHSPCF